MLPSDFSPEKQARQRFLKREADMRLQREAALRLEREPAVRVLREAKVKVSTTSPVWVVEVQFENADYEREDSANPRTLTDSFVDSFMRFVSVARLGVEERVRENRVFVQVPARTSREAEKVVKDLLTKAIKDQRDSRLQSRGRR